MGAVYLANQLAVGNRPVALKVLRRRLLDDPDFLQRFQDEASSTGRIRHQNVVTVHECGQAEDGSPYIAMEYLDGESLRQTLKQRGPLPLPETAEILKQLARGLNAAHKLGIIHRDLKPDNIFLTHDDDGRLLVKIVDFGIAKMRESGSHTMTGLMIGTPAYMSPEQAAGMRSDQLDGRSDTYSLGIVIYEMIGGRVPFQADTPLSCLRKHLVEPPPPFRFVRPDVSISPQVEAVVMKALEKERDHRYPTPLDFAREFSVAVSPSARPVTTDTHHRPAAKAHYILPQPKTFPSSVVWLLTAAAAVALILVLAVRHAPEGPSSLDSQNPPAPNSASPSQIAAPVTQTAKPTQVPVPTPPPQQPSRSKRSQPVGAKRETPPLTHQSRPAVNPPAAAPQTDHTAAPQPSPETAKKVQAAIALGDLHYNRGEYDEAIAEYKRGLEADPSNSNLQTKIDRAQKAKAAEQRLNQ